MNRKGFTLVELLAIIVILSSVTLVVIASVSTSLIRRDEKECMEQKELAKNAAKIYFSLTRDYTTGVTVGTLKSAGYFSANKKIDRLEDNWIIIYQSGKYVFKDEDTLVCKDS